MDQLPIVTYTDGYGRRQWYSIKVADAAGLEANVALGLPLASQLSSIQYEQLTNLCDHETIEARHVSKIKQP